MCSANFTGVLRAGEDPAGPAGPTIERLFGRGGAPSLPCLSRTTPARGGRSPGLDLDRDEAKGGAAAPLTRNSAVDRGDLHVMGMLHRTGITKESATKRQSFLSPRIHFASSSILTSPGVFTGHRWSQREKSWVRGRHIRAKSVMERGRVAGSASVRALCSLSLAPPLAPFLLSQFGRAASQSQPAIRSHVLGIRPSD